MAGTLLARLQSDYEDLWEIINRLKAQLDEQWSHASEIAKEQKEVDKRYKYVPQDLFLVIPTKIKTLGP